MRSRLLMLGAALPLVAVPLVLPSGVSQGAVAHAGITGVTRTISAGPAVAFPRPQQGTVGAPASPEINPAGRTRPRRRLSREQGAGSRSTARCPARQPGPAEPPITAAGSSSATARGY